MSLRTMTNNSIDGSVSRSGSSRRTNSLKYSGKEKPPLYRTSSRTQNSSEASCASVSNSSSQVLTSTPVTDSDLQEKAAVEYENSTNTNTVGEISRGIPNSEITGSSIKKPAKPNSKLELPKKSSKLPRLLIKNTQENRPSSETLESPKIEDRDSLDGSQLPTRRNSLERPSYYNSLYKSGFRPYSDSMSKSINLPSDHFNTVSSDVRPSLSTSLNRDSLDKYLNAPVIDGDRSTSEFDYHSSRPYATLGRTLSMKNPSRSFSTLRMPVKSSFDNSSDVKFTSPITSLSRGSSLKDSSQRTSRFLRPKSFYGVTDVNYSEPSSPGPATSAGDTRRSPSYQRSISLFEGKKPEIYQRSLSVTPDRSVLGKYFNDPKIDDEPSKVLKEINREKAKSRKVSRFLRPDFYDTPKEDSAYEKKEKVKNVSNGQIWKEKTKQSGASQKKSSKKSQEESKSSENRLSMVDKAIRSLRENSLGRNDYDSIRESNLIKRAVSLEDCSLVPENRVRRSTSLTPQSNHEKKSTNGGVFQKKKIEDYKKIVDKKLNSKTKENETLTFNCEKEESVIERISRKLSPRNISKLKTNESSCNGVTCQTDSKTNEDINQESRSRINRIAGLKRLEFSRPIPSADSTPSMEESKVSGDFDDSSSFLSPTEDGSDTWSISSEYADARDVLAPSANEDSVSERIRRKSFYSRFNQTKRRKSSQTGQLNGSRSRLPVYSKSMTSDLTNPTSSNPQRKISDPEAPVEK